MDEVVLSTWGGWTPGGQPSPPPEAGLSLDPERKLKAFLGWDGVIILDGSVNVVDLARAYLDRARVESCGQCFPCRMGTVRMSEILNRICAGRGREGDLERLEKLAVQVKDTSKCDIGQTSPRPILDLIRHFRPVFREAIRSTEPIPAGSYLSRVTAPCMNACPSHVNIPGYLEKLRFGRWDQCLELVRQDCCLPGTIGRVCVRPCEFNCRRTRLDQPISIKWLKRFAADAEIRAGVAPDRAVDRPEGEAKADRVAIVGAGPAGLACAFHLGRLGYRSTVFENLSEGGGMAAVGIPDYRLPRDILGREIKVVESLGAEIRYGVNVGVDITVEEMLKGEFKAVFVSTGAPESASMRCEGEDAGYHCFMTGIEFLRETALGRKPIEGDRMAVIGGGNVAMDCCRTAIRSGFSDVNLIYRRTRAEMPADPVEIEEAKEEGIKFHYLVQPVEVLAKEGRVTGLKCIRMELGEPDESGRRRPVPVEGSEFTIEADAVVPAIGQVCVVDCVLPPEEYELTRWNTLQVDQITGQSKKPLVFGGGDCITGPATLIAALAAGKRAAKYIARQLETGKAEPDEADLMDGLINRLGVFLAREKMPFQGRTKRAEVEALPPEERIKSFDEVEEGLGPAAALNEADRCLRCYRIVLAAV